MITTPAREREVAEEFILDLVNFHWSDVSEGPGTRHTPPHLTSPQLSSVLSLNTKHSQHSNQAARPARPIMQLPLMEPERTQLVQNFADPNELKTEQNTERVLQVMTGWMTRSN